MAAAGPAASLLTIIGFILQPVRIIYRTTESIRDGLSMLRKVTIAAEELGAHHEQLRNWPTAVSSSSAM